MSTPSSDSALNSESNKTLTKVDRQFIFKQIARKHGLKDPKIVNRIPHGTVSYVFTLDGKYILKINPTEGGHERLHLEAEVYRHMSGKEWIPRVIGFDNTRKIVPHPYLLIEQMSGKPISQYWMGLDRVKKNKLWSELGNKLGTIHGTLSPPFPKGLGSVYNGFNNHEDDFIYRFGTTLRKLDSMNIYQKLNIDLMIQRCQQIFTKKSQTGPALLHGNFSTNNLIGVNGRITGVIDWEYATVGSPMEDLAIFTCRFNKSFNDPDSVESFLGGYQKHMDICQSFDIRKKWYLLLYYMRFSCEIPSWSDRPDKQNRYVRETNEILNEMFL